jgi:hypothetical protein
MENDPAERRTHPSLFEAPEFLMIAGACTLVAIYWVALTREYYMTNLQAAELTVYLLSGIGIPATALYLYATRHSRREQCKVHPPLVMSPSHDGKFTDQAWQQDAVVLGYDIHGTPWLWTDKVRVMQGIVLGMTGSGKTTLLKNIITQDLMRRTGPPEERHNIPMVIFDGKGDLEFFQELLPYIHRAGRLGDLRLINPARPDLSSLYNPFYVEDDDYMAQVNMVFGSFRSCFQVCGRAVVPDADTGAEGARVIGFVFETDCDCHDRGRDASGWREPGDCQARSVRAGRGEEPRIALSFGSAGISGRPRANRSPDCLPVGSPHQRRRPPGRRRPRHGPIDDAGLGGRGLAGRGAGAHQFPPQGETGPDPR